MVFAVVVTGRDVDVDVDDTGRDISVGVKTASLADFADYREAQQKEKKDKQLYFDERCSVLYGLDHIRYTHIYRIYK